MTDTISAQGNNKKRRIDSTGGQSTLTEQEALIASLRSAVQKTNVTLGAWEKVFGDANNDASTPEEAKEKVTRLHEDITKLRSEKETLLKRESVLLLQVARLQQNNQSLKNRLEDAAQFKAPVYEDVQRVFLDPRVNEHVEKLQQELSTTQNQLKQSQDDLLAMKFNPQMNIGRKLIEKCRQLHQENEDLGKQLESQQEESQKVLVDLSLQKAYIQELKRCYTEAEEIIDAQQAEIKLLQKLLADGRAPQRKCSKTNDAKEGEPAHNAVEEKDQTDSSELVAN